MKVSVLFYSMYGHNFAMAKAAAEGAKESGVVVELRRIAETLPEEVLKAMGAYEAQKAFADIPVATVADLEGCDGLVMAFPTRFGIMPAQVKTLLDATGQIWGQGSMVGKPVTLMTSSAMQHGGQEATILTSLPFFLHHGMVIVGLPMSSGLLGKTDQIEGGSFYGASVVAGGKGERAPTANDLACARFQGKHLAELTKKLRS